MPFPRNSWPLVAKQYVYKSVSFSQKGSEIMQRLLFIYEICIVYSRFNIGYSGFNGFRNPSVKVKIKNPINDYSRGLPRTHE